MAEVDDNNGQTAALNIGPNPEPGPNLDDILKLPAFEYPSLPTPTSIRLVELLPSPDPDIIRCTMSTVDLDTFSRQDDVKPQWETEKKLPKYSALSYTWGDPITILEEPIPPFVTATPGSDESVIKEYYTKNPFVYTINAPGGTQIFNTDYAMKYYLTTHPYLPKETLPSSSTPQEDHPEKPIEIDGHVIHVQENLHHFLRYFYRLKYHSSFASPPTSSQNKTPPDDNKDAENTHNDNSKDADADDDPPDPRLLTAIHAPLWIDALCINQSSPAERTSQVLQMDRVYQHAARVFAWLGPPDGLTRDAIAALDAIYDGGGNAEGKITLSSFPTLDLVHWFALFAFFQRSWFRRAWVVQEAVFGRGRVTVLYGGQLMPWEWLGMMGQTVKKSGLGLEVGKLGRNLLRGGPLSDSTRQIRKLVRFGEDWGEGEGRDDEGGELEGRDGWSFMTAIEAQLWRLRREGEAIFSQFPGLLRVLSLFRGTEASDPRDKVFAFLNLASDRVELGLVPDYEKTVQEVFKEVTERLIRRTKSLSVLSQVQEPCDTVVEGLPGWVPDFSAHPRSTPLDNGEDDVRFKACGSDAEAWFEIHDDGTLEIETINVDIVNTATPYEHDIEDMVFQILKLIIRIPHDYPIGNFVDLDSDDDSMGELEFEDDMEVLARMDDDEEWTDEEEGGEEEEEEDYGEDEIVNEMVFGNKSYGPDEDEGGPEIDANNEVDDGDDQGDEEVRDPAASESESDHTIPSQELDMDKPPSVNTTSPDGSIQRPVAEATASPDIPKSNMDLPPRRRYRIEAITRIEALWRCLVGNILPTTSLGMYLEAEKRIRYPAPTSLGDGFSSWVLAHMLEMWYLLQEWDANTPDDEDEDESQEPGHKSPTEPEQAEDKEKGETPEEQSLTPELDANPPTKEEQKQHPKKPSALKSLTALAARRFFTTSAIYTALYHHTHIPLTPSTVEFSLPSAELTTLATHEREGITDTLDYLPSAETLVTLLETRPPPRAQLKSHTCESAQDALDGQWWELAISRFSDAQRDKINAFEKRMRSMMAGRKLFTTVGGLLGVGPRSLFGDAQLVYEVHVAKGGKVPYILARPRRDTEEEAAKEVRYRLVGEAYVHGIMGGEIPDKIQHEQAWARYERLKLV